ncbi:hypothetical protein Ancab_022504 [Ancistrocladus abbreviatus]
MEHKHKILVVIFLASLVLSTHSLPLDGDKDLAVSMPTSLPIGKGHLPVDKGPSSFGKYFDVSYSAPTALPIGKENLIVGKDHSSIGKNLEASFSAPTSLPISKEHSTVGKDYSSIGKNLDTSFSAPISSSPIASSSGKGHSTVGKDHSTIGKGLGTSFSAPMSSPIGKEYSTTGKDRSSIDKDLHTSFFAPASTPIGKEQSSTGKDLAKISQLLFHRRAMSLRRKKLLPPSITPTTNTKTTTDSSSSLKPFAALESLISPLAVQKAAPAPPEVVKACKNTDFPSECQATVMPSLQGKIDNPVKILDSSVHTFSHALELAKTEISTDKEPALEGQKTVVKTCKEMYDNALEELKMAQKAADTGDKYGANIRFSAALTYIETCEDGLRGPAKESALATANEMLSKLASNNLALGSFALGVEGDDD